MTGANVAPPARQRKHQTSYLLSYLQKANLNADIPKFIAISDSEDENGVRLTFSDDSSLRSSLSDEDARPSLYDYHITATASTHTNSHRDDNEATLDEPGESQHDGDDEDDDLGDEEDPDDLTNLPYKSPPVYQLPGFGNSNKFRTIVRDGPVGTALGENERFVVIGKRSFRGAGLYPRALVYDDADVEMQGTSDDIVADNSENREEVATEEDKEQEDEVFEGEVEVMCSSDGEEFLLVRNPTEDGSIGRDTSWVAKEWFLGKKNRRANGSAEKGEDVKVDLRVPMEE
ncbi:hypothetical protein ABW21_db0201697 [Orbilia brochopaga]|nr:hypothetical protein ABW21_db0201697 [Drechslerella brochopaga]